MNILTHILAAMVGGTVGIFALACCYVGRSVETCEDASNYGGVFKCSKCRAELDTDDVNGEPTLWINGVANCPNYCPNCGAKVVGE